jgi:hypothetical protein
MFTAIVLSSVLSQATTPASPAPVFVFTPGVDATIYDFKGAETLVEVTPTLVLPKVWKDITITAELPIFSQSDHSGISNLTLVADTNLWEGSLFGGKSSWTGDFGILVPLASNEYTSTSVVPTIGTALSVLWSNKISFSQSVTWTVVANGTAYNALFNSQIGSQWVSGDTSLDYAVNDAITVGVGVHEQWLTTGEWSCIAGPEIEWTPATNWTVSAGVGFPVYQNTGTYQEVDSVVRVGLSVEF